MMLSATPITDKQYQLLWHTLGVTPTSREPYRNHFVAGSGHSDLADLEQLVELELMCKARKPAFLHQNDIVFAVTELGKTVALAALPGEAPEPKVKSRYNDYLSSEYSDSFADFLGIILPTVTYRNGCYQYSRYKHDQFHVRREIAGDWLPTKKAAKASYQEKLKAFNVALRAARKTSASAMCADTP